MPTSRSIPTLLSSVEYLPNRTPEMSISGGADKAFAEVSAYRDGGIYVGHYSGNSEWERHSSGDEIVMAMEGETTVVLQESAGEREVWLGPGDLLVVPAGVWHRFKNSKALKVFTVTPSPTDHRL
jgi:mannose-6-phosphate isomerase-like protein (cupin superfamily)